MFGIDPYAVTRISACHKLCIECHCYHTTPLYFKKRKTAEERKKKMVPILTKPKSTVVDIWRNMTVAELATATNRSVNQVLEAISYSDTAVYKSNTIIGNHYVLYDAVRKLGLKFRMASKPTDSHTMEIKHDAVKRPPPDPAVLVKRHPVVTVMGHVDHGKTTLLDSLRNTSVVASEFGGITQHIGAFNVTLASGERMTFLDTPGHAAFKAMRERGANTTDMVILVVAADDGVMEQTVESIRMAREANVPIIVAINKIDKPTADIERTQRMLSQQGILVEELGGDIQSVNISALHGTNLTALVETVATQAELMNLKGDPTGFAEGVVIEASTDPGRGKLATVLIQRGTLNKRAVLVSGVAWAKVRSMFDHAGQPLSEAKLSEAVQIIGWRDLPAAGDEILEVENERKAHLIMQYRQSKQAEQRALEEVKFIEKKQAEHQEVYKAYLEKKRSSRIGRYRPLSSVGPRKKEIQDDGVPKLNILLKGDVAGSIEAILDVFDTYTDEDRCRLHIVHYGVGPLTESEVELAQAFEAIIYCFNTSTTPSAATIVEENKLPVRHHKIIYKLVDDVKGEITKRLPPGEAEEIFGKANVLQLFVITERKKKWNVAGCRCTEGLLKKRAMFKLKRDNRIIYEGKLASMRHLKSEVDSIKNGVECGLRFEDPNVSIEPGDTLICYRTYETPPETNWDPGF
ncbi:translation initiation factor IF-2, mitochondrial isoform X2 [Venturia canescens]|nr:translation initiation factor IF-2, mitochondrial isoform X2 [Venturia canescens]XP_043273359.1 translation initiation factor IF-2, mitochondrial isoform X2 [Venturia canescens]